MEYYLVESIGWIADMLFVFAYYLVSTKKVEGDGKYYNYMNLAAALLYGTYAIFRSTYPVLILEFFWGGIAIVALWRVYR
jgi:hypothetical protein